MVALVLFALLSATLPTSSAFGIRGKCNTIVNQDRLTSTTTTTPLQSQTIPKVITCLYSSNDDETTSSTDSSNTKTKPYPLQKLEEEKNISDKTNKDSEEFPEISQLLSDVSTVIDEVNDQTDLGEVEEEVSFTLPKLPEISLPSVSSIFDGINPQETDSVESSKVEPVVTTPVEPILSGRDKLPATTSLAGVQVTSIRTNEQVDLSRFLSTGDGLTMLVLATYAADFNAVEYAQRLRYYLPELTKRGISRIGLVLNCEADAAKKLASLTDLPTDVTIRSLSEPHAELFIDPNGVAGRFFGVGLGWKPEADNEGLLGLSPYFKLFGMLWGLGAWATLPAVIGGYIGNPFVPQPWIEDALAVGQKKDRWPNTALELNDTTGDIVVNKFAELPLVGSWKRRPLELATLRLQNMVDISIKNWSELAPTKDALNAGVLTQLGGCVIVDSSGDEVFTWRDPGICAVANFEDILKKVPSK